MGILSWILVGLVAGWLADMVMKGKGRGILFSLVLGIVGALVGGYFAGLLGVQDAVNGFNITSLLTAFIGAVVLIFIVRAIAPGRSPL